MSNLTSLVKINFKLEILIVSNVINMATKRKMSEDKSQPSKKPKVAGHWSLGLVNAVNDPKLIVESDDLVTVIKDGYPKARYHYLVLPKESITSIKSVTKEHEDLLKHMHDVGEKLASKHEGNNFLIGYHALPSMSLLHLHVISDDMDSPCLKNKKHWNSFTTGFFLRSKDILNSLKETGKIKLLSKEECDKLMKTPLKCNKCDFTPKNLPDLKKHILSHIN